MKPANKTAYIKSKGSLEYRDCKLSYYTYVLTDEQKKFYPNVSVSLKRHHNYSVRTLAIDKSFKKDEEAIKYGVDAGKKYIDQYLKDTEKEPEAEQLQVGKTGKAVR